MNHLVVELLKAAFIVAMFACVSAQLRLLATPMPRALKASLGAFVALLLVPLAYLYLGLAFPAATLSVLPAQRLSIWLYGPFLIAFMHALLHVPMTKRRAAAYFGPAVGVIAVRSLGLFAGGATSVWELLGLLQACGFAVTALLWARRRAAQLKVLVTAFSNSVFNWVLFLCLGLLVLLALDFYIHFVLWIGRSIDPLTFYTLTAPCALYATCMSVALIWRLGSIAPLGPELSADVTQDPAQPTEESEQSRKLELTPEAAADLERQLSVLVRESKIHVRNDLSLPQLASELRVSTHVASELLNHHIGKTFYDFLNAQRVAEAVALLEDPRRNLSMTDIAYEAGFNNPNTFYREFKRRHGVTPAQYRKACRQTDTSVASAAHPALISDRK